MSCLCRNCGLQIGQLAYCWQLIVTEGQRSSLGLDVCLTELWQHWSSCLCLTLQEPVNTWITSAGRRRRSRKPLSSDSTSALVTFMLENLLPSPNLSVCISVWIRTCLCTELHMCMPVSSVEIMWHVLDCGFVCCFICVCVCLRAW